MMRKLTTVLMSCMFALNAHANVIQYFAAGISYNNPSELFQIKDYQFIIGGSGSYANLQFTGSVLNFNTFQQVSGVNSSRTYTVLPYGRIAKRIGKKVVVSLDVTEPYSSNLDWGKNAFTNYANTENFLTDVDVSPKISYDVNEKLHVGGGLNFNFVTENQVNFAFPTGATTYSDLMSNSTSFGLGYNLGLTYLVNQTNIVGALFYSPILQKTRGNSQLGSSSNSNFATDLPLPYTANVSFVHIFDPNWLMSLKVFYIGWDTMKTVRLFNTAAAAPFTDFVFQMGYQNAFAYQAAVRHQCTEKLGLTLVGMLDNSPSDDAFRSLPFPSGTQYLIGLAGDYHFNKTASIELLYGHVFSNPTIQNQVTTAAGVMPFTTGRVNINADILDLKLKIEG